MIAFLLAALLLQPPAAPAPAAPLSNGQINYDYRCKACHEPGQDGVPDRAALSKMKPAAIVKSLETGRMKVMGSTLTAEEKRQIAAFITGAAG